MRPEWLTLAGAASDAALCSPVESDESVDGVRTYVEDSGSGGLPVLFYTGLADLLEVPKSSGLARA